jgi:hypothetical protein
MSNAVLAAQLLERAHRLRTLATAIDNSRALTVHALAAPDTWVGPTPQLCYDLLFRSRQRLMEQRDQLRHQAAAFDRRATELLLAPPTIVRAV